MHFTDYLLSYLLLMIGIHFIYIYYICSLTLDIMNNTDGINNNTNNTNYRYLNSVHLNTITIDNISFIKIN